MFKKCKEISSLFNHIECSEDAFFPDYFQETIERVVREILDESFFNLKQYQKLSLATNCLAGHSIRTALIATGIGRNLQLCLADLMALGIGAILHDIGKIRIDKQILNKPSKLSADEFECIKAHPLRGYEMLESQTWIPPTSLNVIRNHHERLNGTGYPDQKTEKDLHLFDKITAVSDAFDAMTSKRNYRQSYSADQAYQVLLSEASTHLDEKAVKILGDMIVNEGFDRNQESRFYTLVNV
ncbi:HD domain-containing protein [Eubacteriaceae bacterium ES2]|nr:HD domain-containing protein [Eubacteriaceae bacterium ES2]